MTSAERAMGNDARQRPEVVTAPSGPQCSPENATAGNQGGPRRARCAMPDGQERCQGAFGSEARDGVL